MDNNMIIARLAFIKGYLQTIRSQQDEADQELMGELIWTLEEDIDQLEAIELAKGMKPDTDDLPF